MDNHFPDLFLKIRRQTENLCRPLCTEDYVIQGMDDVSPVKWHLAHTSWFFESFLLTQQPNYKTFSPEYHYLFNSYYQSLGTPFTRAIRGHLSRPDVQTVYAYRSYVDKHVLIRLDTEQPADILRLGLEHECQHQELMLMDIKYNFSLHPDPPVYQPGMPSEPYFTPMYFTEFSGGGTMLGYAGDDFCFDNELPAHTVWIKPFGMANRLVSNEEYLQFIESGGYRDPQWWLADGWDWVLREKIAAPLYWSRPDKEWLEFGLQGVEPLNPFQPVAHISFFEADAFARWRGCRLPLEAEWEFAVSACGAKPAEGAFIEDNRFRPSAAISTQPTQFYGDLWEWTASPYMPYPGFQPSKGSLGEYNAKFMNNQRVLKGGSFATPRDHIRLSYRNFYAPDKRWHFGGIRLATDM